MTRLALFISLSLLLGCSGPQGGSIPLKIATAQMQPATLNAPYQAQLDAQGGQPPYTWRVVNGQLPTGVTLFQNGVIVGTPDKEGPFAFTVEVKDSTDGTAEIKIRNRIYQGIYDGIYSKDQQKALLNAAAIPGAIN